jgi:hypothetical protein
MQVLDVDTFEQAAELQIKLPRTKQLSGLTVLAVSTTMH